ncbi:MAG: type II toxin-antitoxin system PemK/MazF family toxin [Flavobacteriales bacterium]|nr:type II toxin-antitoxin system PemK/MazF family toxin [Flavobacteriales bacterium]
MKKGEIWFAHLDPTKGSEQAGYRPVVIISGNLLNAYSKVVWICPLTTQIKRYKGNVILSPTKENGLTKTSEVMNLLLRSISKDRLHKKIGMMGGKHLETIRKGLYEILHLD